MKCYFLPAVKRKRRKMCMKNQVQLSKFKSTQSCPFCVDPSTLSKRLASSKSESLLNLMLFYRDRFRTVCNVTGDGFGAAIIEKFSRGDFLADFESDVQPDNSPTLETPVSKNGAMTHTNIGAQETQM